MMFNTLFPKKPNLSILMFILLYSAILSASNRPLATMPMDTLYTPLADDTLVAGEGKGFGSCWGDYDNDGLADLYMGAIHHHEDQFYKNLGDTTFLSIHEGALVVHHEYSFGGTWGDYNNDGFLDLFVVHYEGVNNSLFTNNGDGTFTPAIEGTLIDDGGNSTGAAWADVNNDGWLDLFVTNTFGEDNILYLSNGDWSFTQVTEGAIVTDGGNSSSPVFSDMDNDGWLDLFVANGDGPNFLYRNNGDGTFSRVLDGDALNTIGNCFSASWGDYDRDGDMDLYITHTDTSNVLYQNDGTGLLTDSGILFEEQETTDSRGCAWGDADNDGWLDIVATGHRVPSVLNFNNGDGTFSPVRVVMTNSFGASFADIDRDGDLDLLINNNMKPNTMLIYTGQRDFHWINILCRGTVSNASAIGARVRVKAVIDGQPVWQTAEITSQTGFGAQNSLNVEFGLGDAAIIDSLQILWPSGLVFDTTQVAADQFITLTEFMEIIPDNDAFQEADVLQAPENPSTIGVAWADYDADGDMDLYAVNDNSTANLFFENQGDGSFLTLTATPPVMREASNYAATWGDYDNNGTPDLFVTTTGLENHFFVNLGNGNFGEATPAAGPMMTETDITIGASWIDYDNDGQLDLFTTNRDAANGLYRNRGDGTFHRVATDSLPEDASTSFTGSWGDYDNDGDADLFVTNIGGENNLLYQNNGDGTLTAVTTGAPVNDGGDSWGASWGDYDNDGWLDLFVANEDGVNFLYQNAGNGTFTRITQGKIATDDEQSHGCAWGDVDHDGDLDLAVTNVRAESALYLNDGDGTFSKTLLPRTWALGCAFADYDADGDLDLAVASYAAATTLYENTAQNSAWLKTTLFGRTSNRSAIGARVSVYATVNGNPGWQIREISGQTGFAGQNALTAHFGLGDATLIDTLRILWPSGLVWDTTGVVPSRHLNIDEFNPEFRITSIEDVPADDGLQVTVHWTGHARDIYGYADRITEYALWAFQDDWVEVASVPADHSRLYSLAAATLYDSIGVDIPFARFKVRANTADAAVFYETAADSGYSVNNLIPPAPIGLSVTQTDEDHLQLDWDDVNVPDLMGYRVYRSVGTSIHMDTASVFMETVASNYLDIDVAIDETYFYRVTAVDSGFNESVPSEEVFLLTTDVEPGQTLPTEFALYQNQPNPFNPETVITYALPKESRMKLTVYDLLGNTVAVLRQGVQAAGHHTIRWTGRNSQGHRVASGVYFYRLEAGEFKETRKMLYVR